MTDQQPDAEQCVRDFTRVWPLRGRDAIERIHADRAYELRATHFAEVLRLLDEARGERDLAQAERAAAEAHIDDTIARDAARLARRAKEVSDRAAYLAQFATDPRHADANETDTSEGN